MSKIKLGRVQTQIMQVLWDRGEATAREITEELNRSSPIAHSTVQTLLRGLLEKQAVSFKEQGRTFVFRATVASDNVRKSATKDFIGRVFNGSAKELVSYLLKNEKLSAREMDEIKALIQSKNKIK
jgi:BlaI family transcriptional regulator, penicillinase repressor